MATITDVEVSLGRSLSADDLARVNQLIGDARMLIAARLGDLGGLDQAVLAYVVREAVVARMRNPEGFQSESVDDYTYRWSEGSRRVQITDEWWELLSPTVESGAFTIGPWSPRPRVCDAERA